MLKASAKALAPHSALTMMPRAMPPVAAGVLYPTARVLISLPITLSLGRNHPPRIPSWNKNLCPSRSITWLR